MDFFDDEDPFDSIMRDFFRETPFYRKRKEQFIRGEEEDRIIDFVEEKNYVYLIFELPGYEEKDISISINERDIEISAKKLTEGNIQDYLNKKLKGGLQIRKRLPSFVETGKFSSTVKNGILEIKFEKINGGKKNEGRKIRID